MPMHTVNGLRFHVQQAGAGPDVVLIHGVTGDLSIWFLCEAMAALGASHRVTLLVAVATSALFMVAFDRHSHRGQGIIGHRQTERKVTGREAKNVDGYIK